jgi:glycerol-3-phosphate acyltransferase PlsY
MSARGLAFTIAVAIVVIWSHRANIKRLLNGTESKFAIKH